MVAHPLFYLGEVLSFTIGLTDTVVTVPHRSPTSGLLRLFTWGSAEKCETLLLGPKAIDLAGSVVLVVLRRKVVTLPSYIGSRLGVWASLLLFAMVNRGLKPDVHWGKFRCWPPALHPQRKDSLVSAHSLVDDFPHGPMSMVCPPQSMKHRFVPKSGFTTSTPPLLSSGRF